MVFHLYEDSSGPLETHFIIVRINMLKKSIYMYLTILKSYQNTATAKNTNIQIINH